MFTGPSGHGKTELAKQMGELLSLPFLKVDCTGLKFESDLFGPRAPYAGHQDGSQLNNFLSVSVVTRYIPFHYLGTIC